jgi:hypothetical protein
MPNDLPSQDPKAIWQNQSTETQTMTSKLIRSRARDLRAKTRKRLLGTVAGPLATLFFYVFGMRDLHPLAPLLQALFAFALAWSLVGVYFLNRGMWSEMMPGDAGLSTGLEFCRRELERQHHILRGLLLWACAPTLLAIGTFIFRLAMIGSRGRGIIPNGLPFLVFIAIWLSAYFVLRWKEQSKLKREIDEVDDIARENSRLCQ